MADNTKGPLVGGDSDNFVRLMDRAMKKIKAVETATETADSKLKAFATDFDLLAENSKGITTGMSELAKEMLGISKIIKDVKFNNNSMNNLTTSLAKLQNVQIDDKKLEAQLKIISDAVTKFNSLGNFNNSIKDLKNLGISLAVLSKVDAVKLGENLNGVFAQLDKLNKDAKTFDFSELQKQFDSLDFKDSTDKLGTSANKLRTFNDTLSKLNESSIDTTKISANLAGLSDVATNMEELPDMSIKLNGIKDINTNIRKLENIDYRKIEDNLMSLFIVLDDLNKEAAEFDFSNINAQLMTVNISSILQEYTDSIKEFKGELSSLGKVHATVNMPKENQPRGPRDGKGNDKTPSHKNGMNQAKSGLGNLAFSAVNNFGGEYGRMMTQAFRGVQHGATNISNVASGTREMANARSLTGGNTTPVTSALDGMGEAASKIVSTAKTGIEALAGMSAAALAASAIVAGLVIALGAMAVAGKYAYERNMEVNRSLMSMGDTSNEMTSSTSRAANQMIDMKNTWQRVGDDLTKIFEPVFAVITDGLNRIGHAVESVTSLMNTETKKQYSSTDSKARWYTSQLMQKSGIPENQSLPEIGDIASSAKQSGIDNTSSANLAIGTYDMAIAKARQYGLEANDVAKQLADAWLNGTNAAKNYGVVVDDNTLKGFMASKGVDIVNVQITDAMKQYYRYQLMQTEVNASSSDAMQDQIKGWTQLGMRIDATKQKLFSFDEVIPLMALDTSIPTVGTPDVSYPNVNGDSGAVGGIVGGGATPGGASPGGATATGNAPAPVNVPVNYVPVNTDALNPSPAPVNVPVTMPGLDLFPELLADLALLGGLVPFPILLPVIVDGLEQLPTLEGILEKIKGLVPFPVNIPVLVPSLALAPELLAYCIQLSTNPFVSVVAFMIPALALAPELLGYLGNIAKTWEAQVNLSVIGQELLQRAQDLINNVLGLIAKAGGAISNGVSTVVQDVHSVVQAGAQGTLNGIQSANDYLVNSGISGEVQKADDWLYQPNGQLNNYAKGIAVAPAAIPAVVGAAVTAPAAIPAMATSAAAWLSSLQLPSFIPSFGMAGGGIGTKESTIRAFEGGKAEDVIPLESQEGVDHLAGAMKIALGQSGGGGNTKGGDMQLNVTLSGLFVADNDEQWQQIGEKLESVIYINQQKRGALGYGIG